MNSAAPTGHASVFFLFFLLVIKVKWKICIPTKLWTCCSLQMLKKNTSRLQKHAFIVSETFRLFYGSCLFCLWKQIRFSVKVNQPKSDEKAQTDASVGVLLLIFSSCDAESRAAPPHQHPALHRLHPGGPDGAHQSGIFWGQRRVLQGGGGDQQELT